jgi:hypothetical protein
MTVVSYRIRCEQCSNEEVIREREMDDTPWSVNSIASNSGVCPNCNDAVDLSEVAESDVYEHELELEGLDHIGAKAAQNLREAGYDTVESIADAADDGLLDVSWVGEAGLLSLKEAAMQLPPQQRWQH